ncbi:hypothetical protein AB0N56_36650 [Streptomyces microflavus]|uniref:hypothetical protein n=1 Tax=Streptomyces microflavus TaxID=1919 RepID=UPI0022596D0D|nr:hypothetical protein [Streptomyces microflavus]MCX4657266.1 hypothetical protein [Streptomyces microflavus]
MSSLALLVAVLLVLVVVLVVALLIDLTHRYPKVATPMLVGLGGMTPSGWSSSRSWSGEIPRPAGQALLREGLAQGPGRLACGL